jgi:hypothetical protein
MSRKLMILIVAIAALTAVPSAFAEATRTWVSGVGDDANPCSRTAPCKTFAGAISKTAAGGEINCLDPGGFGVVTITKSITIDCDGTFGSILACSANGVILNGANIVVKLRALAINGCNLTITPGINGIRVLSAKSLRLEEVHIYGFGQRGISWESVTPVGKLFVNNSYIHDNNAAGVRWIGSTVNALGGRVTIVNSMLSGNSNGLVIDGNSNTANVSSAVVKDTTIADNAGNGIEATVNAKVQVVSSELTGNGGIGISANTNAIVRVDDSTISFNGTGISVAGGAQVLSHQNNTLQDNTTNGAFTGNYANS